MAVDNGSQDRASVGIYLRALDDSDLDRTLAWHNDSELYTTLCGPFRYVSRSTEQQWLKRCQEHHPREVNLAICAPEDVHIGNIYLRDIDPVSRLCECHIFIGDSANRGRGWGSAAIRLAVQHAFEDLGLERVYLYVLEENAAGVRAYEKAGFQVEGRLRRHAFKRGEFKTVLIMGLCRGDRG